MDLDTSSPACNTLLQYEQDIIILKHNNKLNKTMYATVTMSFTCLFLNHVNMVLSTNIQMSVHPHFIFVTNLFKSVKCSARLTLLLEELLEAAYLWLRHTDLNEVAVLDVLDLWHGGHLELIGEARQVVLQFGLDEKVVQLLLLSRHPQLSYNIGIIRSPAPAAFSAFTSRNTCRPDEQRSG